MIKQREESLVCQKKRRTRIEGGRYSSGGEGGGDWLPSSMTWTRRHCFPHQTQAVATLGHPADSTPSTGWDDGNLHAGSASGGWMKVI